MFWWVGLDLFSLKCNEISSSEFWGVYGFGISLGSLSFCLLYFGMPPFGENRLPLWVPGVLCQHSEVVLWKLLKIQMTF